MANNNTIIINDFEEKHVHNIYSKIAEHFSNTRKIIWPKVIEFINSIPSNSTIMDIGCGNGKNMGTRLDCKYIGVDICQNLIEQAEHKNNCEYIVSNCLDIPISDNSIDYILSIAVIHHLSNYDRRLNSIKEITRLLKKNGKALIYVWSYEQPKFKNENNQDVMVRWILQKKFNNNISDDIYYRFYHLFKKNELDELILNIPNLSIIESGEQHYNWYCIIQKN